MDLVSIIVPIYNSEKTIVKCIESVINQTYKHLEILCIIDGSTDSSENILNNYVKKDNRIKIINQVNSGVSEARNNGIKNSNGKYITFIDSDDWYDSKFIEEMLNKIKKENVDVVRCNYYNEYEKYNEKACMYDLSNMKVVKKELYQSSIQNHFLYNIEGMYNYVMLLMIKSDIIKNKIKFDKDLYMMEDAYFYQELLYSIDSIYFYDKALYHYNKCNNSATRDIKKVKKNINGILETHQKLAMFFENKKIHVSASRINSCHINLIINYLEKIQNKKQLKKIIIELYKDNNFIYLIKNYETSYFKPYRKFITLLFARQNVNLVIYLFMIRKVVRK